MTWGKPWRAEAAAEVEPPKRSRAPIIAVASTATHIALVAWWLLACAPATQSSAPRRIERPAIRAALVHAAPEPVPPAPPPSPASPEPPRPRFDHIAVNRARPDVVMAWSAEEVAYSRDDGATFTISRMPWSSGQRAVMGTNGVVTASGEGVIDIDRRSWWRTDGKASASEGAALTGEVRAWASDAKRTLAVTVADDGTEAFFISTDDARTWTEGPKPPREVYDLDVRRGGRLVASWAWSASCGGGGEGHAKWMTGDAEWTEASRAPIGMLGADDWIYLAESRVDPDGYLVTGHGPDDRVALGPQVPRDAAAWVATDGRSTFIGAGKLVVSARAGVFSPHDDDAPEDLREVELDGRGRLVGLGTRGIFRREGQAAGNGVWRELPVPARAAP